MSHPLPITAVTVHPDGAIVTRAGAVPVVDGRAEVRALPLLLDESSLRAAARGATLRGLKLALDLTGLDRGEEHEPLRAWQAAERRIRLLKSRRGGLSKQRSRLDDLRPPAPRDAHGEERAPGVAQLRAWRQLTAHLDRQTHDLDEAATQVKRELDEAQEDLRLALFNLARSSTEALWRRWAPTRVLTLEVDGEGPLELSLSYRVEGARWAPAYALHADRELSSGRLVRRAVVAQATGEDWRGVSLSLCSSPCTRRVSLPELPALRLGRAQPPGRPAWRPLPPGLDALFPSGDLSEPAPRAAPALPFPENLPTPDELAKERAPEPPPPAAFADDDDDLDEERWAVGAIMEEAEEANAPVFLGAALRDEGAVFGGIGGGGAPPPQAAQALSAPPPAPMAAPRPSAPRRRGGPMKKRKAAPQRSLAKAEAPGGAPRAPAKPPELEPDADLMNYPRLRLAPFHAKRGTRGRLQAQPLHEEVRAAGLPDQAAQRLVHCIGASKAAIRRVKSQRLPPKHVVPGPVDGAFVRLDAQGQVDVPSNGQFTQLALGSAPASLELRYRSVPREDPQVFRRLIVALGGDVPLLPGPVDVYVAGALLRSFELSQGSRGAKVTIGLGAEDGLRVARNVRYREETAGLLRGSRRLHTEVELEIASALSREAQIELLERLPVAGDDSLQVKLEGSDPPAKDWKGDPGKAQLAGGHRQSLRVPAGGLARATFHYSVTMDNKLELVGGDRRG